MKIKHYYGDGGSILKTVEEQAEILTESVNHLIVLKKISLKLSLFLVLISSPVLAEVKLPRFVSDGMVLQRDQALPIWGWADPGEAIEVGFNGKVYRSNASATGKWCISLPAPKAGGPYEIRIKGSNVITIKDVLVGDVWICSGQSNMVLPLARIREKYEKEIKASANPHIRMFTVNKTYSFQVAEDVNSPGWQEANPIDVLNFSAVGYFFAKEIYDKYKIPIGVINISYGATPAEAWTSKEALKDFPHYLQEVNVEKFDHNRNKDITYKQPTVLFNSMVSPVIPYAIKGVVWYQGEGNAKENKMVEYRRLFPTLIKDWRSRWGQGDFPFIFAQLANFRDAKPVPSESDWALLRESQRLTLSLPNTGMAVIHDLGEAGSIHPWNKKDVGARLALAARKVAYKERNLVHSGPTFTSVKIEGNKVVLNFENVGGGLVAKNSKELRHFAIAGADKEFIWANARIEDNSVIVWHDDIRNPVAVRYAWADNPEGSNLYNKEGLPASSFRTDSW